MDGQEDVGMLVEEYNAFFSSQDTEDIDALAEELVQMEDWSPRAAEHLLSLAKDYGSFILRNALAISLALKIEDGDLGF
jgi:hypothetical protein